MDSLRREPSAKINDLSYKVIGAAIEVHKTLGPGYLEAAYEEALCIQLIVRGGIPFARQAVLQVGYKGHVVCESRLDLLVGGVLVVELKAIDRLIPLHSAQVLSYLKATGCQLGLLINFNTTSLPDGIKTNFAILRSRITFLYSATEDMSDERP